MDATVIGLTAVGVAVTGETPRVLVVRQVPPTAPAGVSTLEGMPAPHRDSLPFGPFDPQQHRTLESGLRQWVEQQTGLPLRYVEQLYTFGDRYRDHGELTGGPRCRVGWISGPGARGAAGGNRRRRVAGLVRVPALGGLAHRPSAAGRSRDSPSAPALDRHRARRANHGSADGAGRSELRQWCGRRRLGFRAGA